MPMLKFVILVAILSLHGDFIAVAKPMAMIGDSFQGALYATLAKSMQGNIDRMFYEVSMKPVEAPTVVPPVIMFKKDPISAPTMESTRPSEETVHDIFEPALAETLSNDEITPRDKVLGRQIPTISIRCFRHFSHPRDYNY